MKLVQYSDAQKFDDLVRPILLNEEAENNLPIGLLDQIKGGRYEDPFLAVVKDKERIEAVFVRTPPHHMIVTILNEEKTDGIGTALKVFCLENNIEVPGFVGRKSPTLNLAEQWNQQSEKPFNINMRQRIYKLQEVNDIEISEGEMVQAGDSDIDLVAEWILGFIEDTPEKPISHQDAKKRAGEMIEEESVFFWKVNGTPVSMARRARKTDNGITVNFVYTPRNQRKKGYARSVVARLSAMLLESHQFCTLYTDLDNPTSNKIYMEVGYEPVCDSIMINLK